MLNTLDFLTFWIFVSPNKTVFTTKYISDNFISSRIRRAILCDVYLVSRTIKLMNLSYGR